VGFGASSLGIKLDVENAGARFLLTIFFYVIHEVVYFMIARGMVGCRWRGAGRGNCCLALPTPH